MNMRAHLYRLAVFIAVLGLTPLPQVVAADGDQAVGAEQARIDAAVQAYVKKQQAEFEKDIDRRIANQSTALLRDPATPVIGNPQGDVAVIEFFDYACPYCKAVEPRLRKLVNDDKGVKLILKEFPILTPESVIAAKAALASVKQGKYQQFHQALIDFRGRLQTEVIFDTAKSVGLDVYRLRRDMEAPEVTDEIIANFNLARGLRIVETPGFIAGGHMLTGPSAKIDFPKVVSAARAK
jgi:protein-disulfide isomerase